MKTRKNRLYKVADGKDRGLLPVIALLLAVAALLSSCETTITPTGIPDGAEKCSSEDGTYTCTGLADHAITISNVPENVSPYVLPVSAEREQELRKADKEGTACIVSVVADLAFYDADNNLVTSFSEPVNITYSFTDSDQPGFEECQASLVDQKLVADPAEVQFLPVYFSEIWKPFPAESYGVDGNTANIRITTWGDSPAGWGTSP